MWVVHGRCDTFRFSLWGWWLIAPNPHVGSRRLGMTVSLHPAGTHLTIPGPLQWPLVELVQLFKVQ